MTKAKKEDWETKPLPGLRTPISLDRSFEPQEMECIRRGLVPEQMEDKWFIFWEDDTLFFHRSWTGFCIYAVDFICDEELCRMVSAEANRDPAQYSMNSDERDAELISYLIDRLLLRRGADFPDGEPGTGDSALRNWGLVGRAALGNHPWER